MKIVIGKSTEKGDKQLSTFICAYVLASSLNIATKTILQISDSAWSLVSYGFMTVIILTLIFALPTLITRRKTSLALVELIFILLYFISWVVGEVSQSFLLSTAFWTLAVCIPLCIAGIAIDNKEVLFNYLRITSFIELPFLCIALLRMRTVGSYSMSASYALILPVLYLIEDFFEKRSYIALGLGVCASALILIFGARGPFLCVALYAMVKLFSTKNSLRIIIIRIGFIITVGLILLFWGTIIQKIQSFLVNNGIHSYALQRLISGQITETAGRDALWKYYFGLIQQRPIFGYGLQGGWLGPGNGPHNMLLEFFLAFGIIGGGVLSVFSIFLLLFSVFRRNGKSGELILILAFHNFTMYLVSGNWLEKPLFFLFAALAIAEYKNRQLRSKITTIRNT